MNAPLAKFNGQKKITVSTDGTYTYKGVIKNSSGSNTCSINVNLDKTVPKSNGNTGGSTSWSKIVSKTVGVNCSDDTSCCTQTNFTIEVTNECKTKSITITIKDNADNTDNTTDCTSTYNIYLDRTTPVFKKEHKYVTKYNTSGPNEWGKLLERQFIWIIYCKHW